MHLGRPTSRLVPLLIGLTGWLYLIAGLAMLAAVVIIPAHDELDLARLMERKAAAQVQLRRDMQEDAGERLAALAEPSDALLASLAQTHLNLAPVGTRALDLHIALPAYTTRLVADTRPSAEPRRSPLARLVTTRPARSIIILAAAICILIALLPPSEATNH